jgi:Phosphate-selective porin O and P
LGFQAEYNLGRGPEFDPISKTTKLQNLNVGYAQTMYRIKKENYTLIPFIKYQYYNGGKKFEIDARKYRVKDLELGIEYQIKDYFELVGLYMISDRIFEDYVLPINHQKGRTLRLQAQFNF